MADEASGFGFVAILVTAAISGVVGGFFSEVFARRSERRSTRRDLIRMLGDHVDTRVELACDYWQTTYPTFEQQRAAEAAIVGEGTAIDTLIEGLFPSDHSTRYRLVRLNGDLNDTCTGGDFGVRNRVVSVERLVMIQSSGRTLKAAALLALEN